MTLPAFIAWEAVQVANEGGRVLILTKEPREVLMDLLNNSGQELARTTRRTNGSEGMDFHSGGTIQIHWDAHRLRGYTAHLAIVPIGTSQDDLFDILPCLSTVKDSAIVGYLAPAKVVTTQPAEAKADRIKTGRFTSHPAGWVDGRTTWRAAKAKRLAAIAAEAGCTCQAGGTT